MLTGPELGQAIERARVLKRVTKKAMADHFGVQPPSIQDWVKSGTISKAKLPALWAYFSDVVGPEHWGLSSSYPTHAADPAAGKSTLATDKGLTTDRAEQLLRDLLALLQSLPDGRWPSLRAQLDRVVHDPDTHDSALQELRFLLGLQEWNGSTERRAAQERRQNPLGSISKARRAS